MRPCLTIHDLPIRARAHAACMRRAALAGFAGFAALTAFAGAPARAGAQDPSPPPVPARPAPADSQPVVAVAAPAGDSAARPARPVPMYESTAPLTLTLTADLRRIDRDRGDDPPWRGATLGWTDDDGTARAVPMRVRTRGIWRRKNCAMPPLRLNFWKDSVRGTPFERLDKPKLVGVCRDDDRHEDYVLREFQLYRIYQLLTPYSHRARLVRLAYADSGRGAVRTTRWAFLIEEPDALARRIGADEVELQGAGPDDLEAREHLLVAFFQYLIGNTDWSVHALHNAELFFHAGRYLAIAYDFDYSGAVNAHYAIPDPRLNLRSVRTRLYRGYCVDTAELDSVIALFRERRAAIYALYEDDIGRLLPERTVRETLRYFDDFYRVLEDPAAVRRLATEGCLR